MVNNRIEIDPEIMLGKAVIKDRGLKIAPAEQQEGQNEADPGNASQNQ